MEGFLDSLVPILAATVRVATPLILAALAGLFSERAGIINVGLEGKMLAGAFAAASAAAISGSVWVGFGAAILAACALALVHAVACITLRGNQVVSGMAINILASGLSATLALAWFQQGGQTPTLPNTARFQAIPLPGAEWIAEIPILGRILVGVAGGHTLPVYLAFALVPLVAFVLWRTRFGLRLRACGENPAAADSAGVPVARMRYAAVLIAGALCGMAGATIATAQSAGFDRDMTAGRGFIALAALILAHWKPWPVLLTCLLFGLLDAVAIRLQGWPVPGLGVPFPVQAVQALPYILTVILLAGFVGRAIPPKAIGIPFVKER
jgi:general nucleoside transport system permease protein